MLKKDGYWEFILILIPLFIFIYLSDVTFSWPYCIQIENISHYSNARNYEEVLLLSNLQQYTCFFISHNEITLSHYPPLSENKSLFLVIELLRSFLLIIMISAFIRLNKKTKIIK